MDPILQALEDVKTAFTIRLDGIESGAKKVESRVAAVEEIRRSGPADHKKLILEALIAPLKGKSADEIARTMGADFLRVEEVKQVLPPLDIGTDMMEVFLTQPAAGVTAKLGFASDDPLDDGAVGDATDWSAGSVAVSLWPHHHYKGFSEHEANAASVDAATEIGKAFFRRRNKKLRKGFVDGDDTKSLKGITTYTVSHNWADKAGKIFCEVIGAAGAYTIAQFRAGVQAAKNRLPTDCTPLIQMRGDTKGLAENDTEDNVAYYKTVNGVDYYCGCEVVRNDYLPAPSAAADKIIAAVMAKKRGYGVAYNPRLVVSADKKADKTNLYTGQSLGGAIADNSAIVGIEVAHA